jgi:hypothetical protein
MADTYNNAGFNTEQVTRIVDYYPLINVGDDETKAYDVTVRVNRGQYKKLKLDTKYSLDPRAILVDQTKPKDVGGGVVELTRTYSYIPKSRQEPGLQAWTRPGFNAVGTGGASNVSSVNFAIPNTVLTVDDTSNFAADTSCTINLKYTQTWNTNFGPRVFKRAFVVRSKIVSVDSGASTITVISNRVYLRDGSIGEISDVSGIVISREERKPKSIGVPVVYEHSFFHEDDVNNIQPTEPFTIYDSSREEVDSLTTTTKPTFAEYEISMNDKEMLQMAFPEIKRYKGNIMEIVTPFVMAQ